MWNRGGRKQQTARIEALEKAMEGFESRTKLLRMEWEDVFDRMNRVMGRLNARIRKSEGLSAPESDAGETPQPAASPPGVAGTHEALARMRGKFVGLLPR